MIATSSELHDWKKRVNIESHRDIIYVRIINIGTYHKILIQ